MGHEKKYHKLRRKVSKKNKSFAAWSDKDEIEDNTEIVNICFMAVGVSSEVRPLSWKDYNICQANLDMITN